MYYPKAQGRGFKFTLGILKPCSVSWDLKKKMLGKENRYENFKREEKYRVEVINYSNMLCQSDLVSLILTLLCRTLR